MQKMNQYSVAVSSPSNMRKYFSRYILEVKKLSMTTEYNYQRGLKKVSQYMKNLGLVRESIYEIGTIEELDNVWSKLKDNPEFSEMDRSGHRMYSAGFNCYYKFATGDMFKEHSSSDMQTLDSPMLLEDPIKVEYRVWKRSGIMRTQTIVLAGYTCDIDHSHVTFIAESSRNPYMEAHHIIPLKLQERFSSSLDVYANLISLCPICHRKIHLGIKEDRRSMIDGLYEKRKERLARCGFILGKEEFEELVMEV